MTIVEIGVYLKFDSIRRGSCNRPYLQGILSKKHWVQRRIETEREYTTQALIRKPYILQMCSICVKLGHLFCRSALIVVDP